MIRQDYLNTIIQKNINGDLLTFEQKEALKLISKGVEDVGLSYMGMTENEAKQLFGEIEVNNETYINYPQKLILVFAQAIGRIFFNDNYGASKLMIGDYIREYEYIDKIDIFTDWEKSILEAYSQYSDLFPVSEPRVPSLTNNINKK